MDTFNDVQIRKKANVYFDGKVTSRTVIFRDGSTKTLGIMLPGEYEFNTGKPERMDILAGELQYQIKDTSTWTTVKGDQGFDVPGNSSFKMKVSKLSDYCCSFLNG